MSPSPTLIALDTATEACSVALLRGTHVVGRSIDAGQAHSRHLLPMLQALLADEAVGLHEVDAFAFGAGPGSFTGLRIACGAVQGLAWGLDKPVLPIGNLRALAAAAVQTLPDARRIAVAVDARMDEAYWAVYAQGTDGLQEIEPPSLVGFAHLADAVAVAGADVAAGNAFAAIALPPSVQVLAQVRATATDIVRLAALDFAAGRAIAAAQAAPLYVRDRVALTTEERRAAAAAG